MKNINLGESKDALERVIASILNEVYDSSEAYHSTAEFAEHMLSLEGDAADGWREARAERKKLEVERNPFDGALVRNVQEFNSPEQIKKLRDEWDVTHQIAIIEAMLKEVHCLTVLFC